MECLRFEDPLALTVPSAVAFFKRPALKSPTLSQHHFPVMGKGKKVADEPEVKREAGEEMSKEEKAAEAHEKLVREVNSNMMENR